MAEHIVVRIYWDPPAPGNTHLTGNCHISHWHDNAGNSGVIDMTITDPQPPPVTERCCYCFKGTKGPPAMGSEADAYFTQTRNWAEHQADQLPDRFDYGYYVVEADACSTCGAWDCHVKWRPALTPPPPGD